MFSVDVVMACYYADNPENLDFAIASILGQSYKNLRLIVAVDGSVGDKIDFIINKNLEKDERFIVVRGFENKGAASARNMAIKLATSDYIAIMDSDDIAFYDRIERQLRFIIDNELDICGSGYIEFDSVISDSAGRDFVHFPSSHAAIAKLMPFFCPLANPTVFARADVLKKYGYDESLRVGEDYSLWVRLMSCGFKFGNLQSPTIYYRRGESFISRRRGVSYAISDFKNKLKCLYFSGPLLYLPIFIFAISALIVRIMPGEFVCFLRAVKIKFFSIALSK
jgi:glycosyltransferase involved in cell wall biosynthesis